MKVIILFTLGALIILSVIFSDTIKHTYQTITTPPIDVMELINQGEYDKALDAANKNLISAQQFEKESDTVASALIDLAYVNQILDNYEKSELLYKHSLEMYTKLDGENSANVAVALNGLGNVYSSQAKYSKAESLYQKAIKIYSSAKGDNRINSATSMSNLADVYKNQSQYENALTYYNKALSIKKAELSEEHVDVANIISDLGEVYLYQHKNDKAELTIKKGLAIQEKILQPNHPDIATSLNNLAVLYYNTKRYSEAEKYFIRSIKIRKIVFGNFHASIATSLNNLANIYRAQKKYKEAEASFLESIKIDSKIYGTNHPDVALDMQNLGRLYIDEEKYEEAKKMFQHALSTYQNYYSQNDQHVQDALNDLNSLSLYANSGAVVPAPPTETSNNEWPYVCEENDIQIFLTDRYFKFASGTFGSSLIDNDTIKIDQKKKIITVWIIFLSSINNRQHEIENSDQDYSNFGYTKQLMVIDYKNKRSYLKSITDYACDNQPIEKHTYDDNGWQPFDPSPDYLMNKITLLIMKKYNLN
jgi:tetratricopeptide (TPR) repeat protein